MQRRVGSARLSHSYSLSLVDACDRSPERIEVRTQVLAVGAGIFIRAARQQLIIPALAVVVAHALARCTSASHAVANALVCG